MHSKSVKGQCLGSISAAVIKQSDQMQPGEEGFFQLTACSPSSRDNSTGTRGKNRSRSHAACWIGPHDLFCQLFLT